MNKKGDAAYAAVLVFLFAIFLILYVLLIPSDARNELLDLDTGSSIGNGNVHSSGTITSTTNSRVLLDVSPGRIEEEGRTQYEYDLPSVKLVRTTDAEIIKKENPFIIKNSWFTKKAKTIEFEIIDKNNINNLLLSFNTLKNEGILSIRLNSQMIYEKDINQYNSDSIMLPKEKLSTGSNTVEFSTSSVGIAFWNANDYSFENVKILADITDVSGQDTKTVFNILDSRDNINEARLRFVPECQGIGAGKLHIRINTNEIFSAVPDCNVLNTLFIPPAYITTGINEIGFKTEKGTYLVDRIKVKTDLKEKREPKFYVYINEDQWEDISDSDYIANMTMEFVVDDEYINMKLEINNRDIGIYQRDEEFTKIIDSYLEEGNNVIKLSVDDDSIDVLKLAIKIEKRKR